MIYILRPQMTLNYSAVQLMKIRGLFINERKRKFIYYEGFVKKNDDVLFIFRFLLRKFIWLRKF
jgi:hypothetical protein